MDSLRLLFALSLASIAACTGQLGSHPGPSVERADDDRNGVPGEELFEGSLAYVIRADASAPPARVLAGLFTNTSCEATARGTISPSVVDEPAVGVEASLGRVEAGLGHALWAVGLDPLGHVASQVCADVLVDEAHERVELDLVDVADIVAGNYELDVELDLGAGFHPALDALLFVLRVLGSPPDEGATLLVDWAASSDRVPPVLKSALGDPIVRRAVASAVFRALEAIHPPEWLDRVIYAGAEMDRALSATVLRTELVVPPPDPSGAVVAAHRVHTLVLPRVLWDDTPAVLEERVDARGTADVAITPDHTVVLGEHVLPLSIGELVEVLLREILLPALGSSAYTLGGALREVLDCASLARTITDATLRELATGVCDAGVELLGAAVEEGLVALFRYDALAIACEGQLVDGDRDRDLETVRAGACDASWSGPSGAIASSGAMRGHRLGDVTGRDHSVRDRLLEHLP